MLSIVIIGKNEAANIDRLARSIVALIDVVDFPVETIFVDSASTDDSVELASKKFDCVVQLEPSPHLCASSGRYVGTLQAQYPFVFYLDGDMEICPEFIQVVTGIQMLEPEYAGFIGLYVHKFDNGNVAVQTFARRCGDGASQFGGAAILRRDAVIKAGNWDPSLYGKEEMELYVRLGSGKPVVKYIRVPMIYHYSEHHSRMSLFRRMLYPSAGLGKVFWGYGQSIRAMSMKGTLCALLMLDYEPYLFWLIVILAGLLALLLPLSFMLALFATVGTGLILWLKPGSVVKYGTLPLSLIPGWFRYFSWFRPELSRWASGRKAK